VRTWPALEVTFDDPATDELLQASISDYQIAAIEEVAPTRWRVFFQTAEERDQAAAALAGDFPDVGLTTVNVADENWAAKSQANLRAIHIGKLVVAPPWDVPEVIVIQPSMGFGTGHHATTRLCLAALQQVSLGGARVLDVGTGSGVLAIAAGVVGATYALGIDDDPDAVQAARENVALNAALTVEIRVADLRTLADDRFDLVLANLTGGLLIETSARLREFVAPSGVLVVSGFMQHEEADVVAAFPDFAVKRRSQEDEWVCATLQRA
jgi:ribosomal protein L11 methyltransferase